MVAKKKRLLMLLLLLAFGAGSLVLGWVVTAPPALPSYQQVVHRYQTSEGILLDRKGRVLHQLRVAEEGRRLDWTPLEKISPALVTAVVHAEDRRFYEHSGVDWLSFV